VDAFDIMIMVRMKDKMLRAITAVVSQYCIRTNWWDW